nr:L-aspartate oxidase [Actibacterium mucosum]
MSTAAAQDTGRVLIVGAGLGALYAALKLAPRPVLMISPDPLGQGASSAWAQGGVAAAMDLGDSPRSHADDTVAAGAGLVVPDIAQLVTAEARDHILDLTALGTPFDRTDGGDYVLSREAAHSYARVVRVKGDQAGAAIMAALIEAVQKTPSIQVVEGALATELHVEGGRVRGVWISSSAPGGSTPVLMTGPAVLLAGGGSAGLYAVATTPPRIRGQVIGMAARAGARIADPEFVQFHPTALDVGEDPAPLATEALRGEGAVLVNAEGARFMTGLHPDAELAPRDVVARAIFDEWRAGRRPMLDTRAAIGARIVEQFPTVASACARHGIDPVTQPFPVAAAAHYHMGGVETAPNGRASLPGLWVCGEASATGLHGANRLASNGLLEALVYGRITAMDISAELPEGMAAPTLAIAFEGAPAWTAPEADTAALRKVMTRDVGVLRDAEGLKAALVAIAQLEARNVEVPSFVNMCATATLIAAAALQRQESRGAHARTDYPDPSPETPERTHITLQQAMDIRAAAVNEVQS